MWKIGFGLERLGLLAIKLPVLFSLFVIGLTAFAAHNIVKLQFDGNVTVVLPDKSQAYVDYYALKGQYRNFSRDVTILVQSEKLSTAAGLEALRDIQLEISLSDDVASVSSILSVPDFDPETGELRDWFPQTFENDAQSRALIKGLIEKYPQARSLFSLEDNVAVLIATLSFGVQDHDDKSFYAFFDLRKAAFAAAPDDFKLYFTGLTPVGATIVEALISDQVKLTILGLLLGAALAFYIFRSLLAALICAVPPFLTAFWALGLFAFFDISINFLTTVLPTLALILAFADGIFLYYRWQALNSQSHDPIANLKEAVGKVGPASSLTSLTTALAFLSFLYAGSQALDQFAYLGASVVLLGFVGVIIGMPIFIYWLIKFGIIAKSKTKSPMFLNLGKKVRKISLKRPLLVSFVGVVLVIGMGMVHTSIKPEYTITDYLPKKTEVYQSEQLANKIIGGRSLLLVSVPLVQGEGLTSPANQKRTRLVEEKLGELFLKERIFSASSLIGALKTDAARARIEKLIKDAPASARTDFVSASGSHALISVRLPSNASVYDTANQIVHLRKKLDEIEFGDQIIVSGFPVLMAVEFTKLIEQLRWSLIIAICLGILFVGVATRSPMIMLAAIIPNLLPIFFVQFLIYLRGGTINMTEVVALTVAFGIAIDNAVHLINVYDAEKRSGKITFHALSSALEEVGPALAAGTTIICAATLVTQVSMLPTVPTIGQFMIATLGVALFANLILFPANILTLEYFKQSWFKRNR